MEPLAWIGLVVLVFLVFRALWKDFTSHSEAFHEGYRAFASGAVCEYTIRSPERDEWLKGYAYAQSQAHWSQ